MLEEKKREIQRVSMDHPLTEWQKMETRTMHLILREQELRIKELKIMR